MSRTDIFRYPAPPTKEAGIQMLRDLDTLGLMFHLDDDPRTIVNNGDQRVFTDEEAVKLEALVDRLNELFAEDPPEGERDRINAGAWAAAEQAGWLDSLKGDDGIATESVQKFVDRMLND